MSADLEADAAAPRARCALVTALVALAVGAIALVQGCALLGEWTRAGTVPGARTLVDATPLAAWSVLAWLVGVAVVKRAELERCALAALAWAFAISVLTELPTVARSQEFCDGPALRGVYLALGALAGTWALCTRERDARAIALALVVFWSAANARLWGRDSDQIWVLLWAALSLVQASRGDRLSVRDVVAGFGRVNAGIAAALLAWLACAAALSDSPTISFTAWLRVAWGAWLAWSLASSGLVALRASWRGLQAAAVAVASVLVVGLVEASAFNPLERVLESRLRLLGMHSNGIGPFLALCVCVCAAELVRLRGERAPWRAARASALAAAAAICVFGLWSSESRASVLGVALGLAALAWCAWMRKPRTTWKPALVLLAALACALVLLATPLAAPLHARLHELTLQPSALGQRYYLWRLAARVLADDPWFGAGPNVYYLHAQYAQTSYYDLLPQVLHSHSLYVGVAEGSGWLGLALLALLCVAVVDALRRGAWTESTGFAERVLLAGTCAALVAILASNALDVGQSRNTFVPLVVWIAFGVGAAALANARAVGSSSTMRAVASAVDARSGAHAETDSDPCATQPPRVAAWIALALLAPLCAAPIAAAGASAHARARAEAGDAPAARAAYELALRLWPLDQEPRVALCSVERAQGDAAAVLEQLRALVATRPGYAPYHLNLAAAELELGDAQRARLEAETALRLDPLGQDSGEASFVLAGAQLRLGDRAGATSSLLGGLRTEGNGWRKLPQLRVPQRGGSGEASHRIAFVLGDPAQPSGQIELDALLATLEQEVRDKSASAPLAARRELGRMIGLLRALGEPRRALALLDDFARVTKFNNASFDVQRLELEAELGHTSEVDALRERSAWRDDSHIVAVWARALLASGERENAERVVAAAPLLERFKAHDVSFDAGMVGGPFALAAQLALQRGDHAHALELLGRARYDCATPAARLALSQPFLALCAKVGVGAPTALEALGESLHDASLDARAARDENAMRQRVKWLRAACGAEPPSQRQLERVCAPNGVAGETFLRVQRASAAGPETAAGE